jgi:hypothetical protein
MYATGIGFHIKNTADAVKKGEPVAAAANILATTINALLLRKAIKDIYAFKYERIVMRDYTRTDFTGQMSPLKSYKAPAGGQTDASAVDFDAWWVEQIRAAQKNLGATVKKGSLKEKALEDAFQAVMKERTQLAKRMADWKAAKATDANVKASIQEEAKLFGQPRDKGVIDRWGEFTDEYLAKATGPTSAHNGARKGGAEIIDSRLGTSNELTNKTKLLDGEEVVTMKLLRDDKALDLMPLSAFNAYKRPYVTYAPYDATVYAKMQKDYFARAQELIKGVRDGSLGKEAAARKFADMMYVGHHWYPGKRGSDAALRIYHYAVFRHLFGKRLQLPPTVDVDAFCRSQCDFVEWVLPKLLKSMGK